MLVSCLTYTSTLKAEVACSSETSLDIRRTTRLYVPEDTTVLNHRRDNLEFWTILQTVAELWAQIALNCGIVMLLQISSETRF
jgi:hypothetical protein